MNAISVDGLAKRFERVLALDGLSFELPSGALALVSGANGAGKSTLLRVLGSLTRPSRGSVKLFGADVFGRGAAEVRARLGYLGAEAGLYADLTVAENLRFGAQLLGVAPGRVASVLELLDLDAVADRRAGTLSSGFQRRAGLARALLAEPDLLLLDEPWNGLDDAAASGLVAILDARRASGATTLIAAHADGARGARFDIRLSLQAGRLASMERASADA